MSKKYILKYNNGSVEMTKPNSTMLIYKIPYNAIQTKNSGFIVPNRFIVYILFGKNSHGKDMVYVGKSKNGIENRPTAHKDKFDNWTTCYVLTQFKERTFFNDGTIQYLENDLNSRVDEVGLYNNTTITTTKGTANTDDMEDCDDYLAEAYKMLDILGLDLISNSEEAEADEDMIELLTRPEVRRVVPNGNYFFGRRIKRLNNAVLKAEMQVKDGKFILLAGSQVTMDTGIGLAPNIDLLRNQANIEDGILLEDVEMESPSAAGEFVIGAACNGWTSWLTKDGEKIDKFRK